MFIINIDYQLKSSRIKKLKNNWLNFFTDDENFDSNQRITNCEATPSDADLLLFI